jgi:hypothetical protein
MDLLDQGQSVNSNNPARFGIITIKEIVFLSRIIKLMSLSAIPTTQKIDMMKIMWLIKLIILP